MDLFKTLFFVFVVFISKSTAMEAVTHDEEPHKKRTPEERVKAATKVVTQINSYLGQEHKSYSSPYRSIDDYCKHSKKTILIVGSGYAYFSLEKFINKSNDYYTIDINKETESSNLKWPNSFPDYVGDITSIDFSVFNVFKNKFDVIIFEGLTNHVLFGTYDDPKKITELLAIKNGLQMLLPEGKLIFNIPPLKVRACHQLSQITVEAR